MCCGGFSGIPTQQADLSLPLKDRILRFLKHVAHVIPHCFWFINAHIPPSKVIVSIVQGIPVPAHRGNQRPNDQVR